jgi:hypothetical protein
MSKMGQRGTWDTLGGPTMPPHHMVARPGPGRVVAWCGAPDPPLTSPPSTSLSLPKYLHSIAFRLAANREKGGVFGGLIATRLLALHGVAPHDLDI